MNQKMAILYSIFLEIVGHGAKFVSPGLIQGSLMSPVKK